MAIASRSAAEAAQQLADALERAQLPHAIGGALALAIAGVPRGTADVDVNVFVPEARIGELVTALQGLGIDVDPANAVFFRGKDLVDLERLVAVRSELDHAYVRRWIVDMMGDADDRVRAWDALVARFGPR
jgi:hypothetical protein